METIQKENLNGLILKRKTLLNKILFYFTLLLLFISCRNVHNNCEYGRNVPSAIGSYLKLIEVKDTNIIYNVLDSLLTLNTSILNKDVILEMSLNSLGSSYDTLFLQINIKQKSFHEKSDNYIGVFEYKGYEIILNSKNIDDKFFNDYFKMTSETKSIYTLDFRIKKYFKEEVYKEDKRLEMAEFNFNFKIVNNRIREITTNYSNNISLKTREELENLYGK